MNKIEFISASNSRLLNGDTAIATGFFVNKQKDNQALVTYKSSLKGTWKCQDYSGEYAVATTWINENEKWRLSSENSEIINALLGDITGKMAAHTSFCEQLTREVRKLIKNRQWRY